MFIQIQTFVIFICREFQVIKSVEFEIILRVKKMVGLVGGGRKEIPPHHPQHKTNHCKRSVNLKKLTLLKYSELTKLLTLNFNITETP